MSQDPESYVPISNIPNTVQLTSESRHHFEIAPRGALEAQYDHGKHFHSHGDVSGRTNNLLGMPGEYDSTHYAKILSGTDFFFKPVE